MSYKTKANDLFRRYLNDNNDTAPTPEKLRALLDKIFDRIEKPKIDTKVSIKDLTFFGWIEKYITDCQNGDRLIQKTNKRFSTSSINGYLTTLKHLKEFERSQRAKFTFEAVDLHFYHKLLKYLNDKNFATNHVGSIVKYLKVFMNNALKDGIHDNRKFEDSGFTKPSETVDNIYLTDNELLTIYKLDLKQLPGLDCVRDLFLIGCHTGLRFSDFSQLKPENFLGEGRILKVATQKTGKGVFIPLNPIVMAIVNKYGGLLPKSITNQQTNQHLKEIGKLSDLTEQVEVRRTKGGKQQTKYTATRPPTF